MRLLLTTDTIGGVWSFTHTLARGLLSAGHAVALVSFGRQPSPLQDQAMRRLEAEFEPSFYFVSSDVPLEWMDHNERTWHEGSNVLLRVIADFAPQLLHSNQMCFGRLNLEIPVVVTAHSDVLSWAEATLSPHGVDQLARTACPRWLQTYRKLVKNGLEDATAVVAPTRWMAETLARVFDLRRLPAFIPNGVEAAHEQASPRKLQAVTAGRLKDQGKGLSVLDQIQMPIPLFLVGEPLEARQREVEAKLLGALVHKDLFALFAQSAIYLATSLYEPFGLAPVEAANHGCAIVARDIPSFREVWGDAALYFESPNSLQRILNSLTNNPRRLRGAQCRARQRAARYTAQAMTANYDALYEHLLARATGSQELMLAHA